MIDPVAVLLAGVWLVCGGLAAVVGSRLAVLAWRDRRAQRAVDRRVPREEFWAPEWERGWPPRP